MLLPTTPSVKKSPCKLPSRRLGGCGFVGFDEFHGEAVSVLLRAPMHLVHCFTAQMVVEFVDDDEGVREDVTVLNGDGLGLGGVASVRGNLVFFGQPHPQAGHDDSVVLCQEFEGLLGFAV